MSYINFTVYKETAIKILCKSGQTYADRPGAFQAEMFASKTCLLRQLFQ